MQRNSKSMMTLGAMGALTGMILVPVLNSKTRKRATRTARKAYFRVADFMQDVKDMRR